MRGLKYVNMFNRGIQRVKNLLQENGNPEPVFNVDKITAFEVIVRPSLSLNLVTDEEKVTKSVTKLSDILNEIMLFCSTPRSMAEIMEHIGLKHRYNVKHRYIDPLIEGGFLVMTIPEKLEDLPSCADLTGSVGDQLFEGEILICEGIMP